MNYGKAIAAVVATVVSAVVAALVGDNNLTAAEWVNVAVAAVGSCAVFAAPNVPGANYTKSVLAFLTAVLTLLVSFITDNVVTGSEWLQLLLAGLGALGVYAAPYAPRFSAANHVRGV